MGWNIEHRSVAVSLRHLTHPHPYLFFLHWCVCVSVGVFINPFASSLPFRLFSSNLLFSLRCLWPFSSKIEEAGVTNQKQNNEEEPASSALARSRNLHRQIRSVRSPVQGRRSGPSLRQQSWPLPQPQVSYSISSDLSWFHSKFFSPRVFAPWSLCVPLMAKLSNFVCCFASISLFKCWICCCRLN